LDDTPDHGTADFRAWAAVARPRLRRTGYLLTGDWHLAEDLTQETLLRMYAAWGRPEAVDAYARTTLVNLHRQLLRRPSRRERVTDRLPEVAVSDRHEHEDRQVLLAALADLGPSQRTIVVLRYWEDLPVAEVAALLRIREGTVKSQASRALAFLRTKLPELAGLGREES
jgi:RNA polymerase sigma-70 factor (sigma-E family)